MTSIRRNISTVLFVVALLLAGFLQTWYLVHNRQPSHIVKDAEAKFKSLDRDMRSLLAKLVSDTAREHFHRDFLHDFADRNDVALYLFEGDGLIAWTTNQPGWNTGSPGGFMDATTIHLSNGDYWVRMHKSGSRTAVGLLLLRKSYPFENRFLKNTFNGAFGLPAEADFSSEGIGFHAPDGKLIGTVSTGFIRPSAWLIAGWWLVVLLLSLSVLHLIHNRSLTFRSKRRLAAAILLVRISMAMFHVPSAFLDSSYFDPAVYAADAVFNSPGDLFLNGLTLLLLVILLSRTPIRITTTARRITTGIMTLLLLAALVLLVHGMVMDASVSFDITDLSGVDHQTLFLLLGLSLFLLAGTILIQWVSGKQLVSISFGNAMLTLCLVSAVTAVLLFRFNHQSDVENRKRLAQRVTMERDPVAEYLFNDEAEGIRSDTALYGSIARGESVEAVRTHIRARHLKEYLGRFDWTCFLYDATGRTSSTGIPAALDSLVQELRVSGRKTVSPFLYSLPAEAGHMRYSAVLPVTGIAGDTLATLILQLRSTFFSSTSGFPELLVSGTINNPRISEKYSFAHYQDGALVYEFGQFPYGLRSDAFIPANGHTSYSLESDGYDHLVVHDDKAGITVVSKVAAGYLSLVTLFSWLFAFFGFFALVVSILSRTFQRQVDMVSLTRRIRLSVFALVVLAFAGTGTGTVFYILQKYENDQRRSISEQLNGVWILLGDRLGFGAPLSELEPRWLTQELGQITSSTNIDFNLFDEKGRLFYSSQPRLFEQGIVSERMEPEAYFELSEFGKTQFIHREKIGSLGYLAAYAPFVGDNGQPTGYLHLPYFEKQYERSREVSGFLSALFNIYILLLAAAVFVTVFISSRVTRPLALIQERLSAIRFGRRNEVITYPVNDEIGQLVNEYNRMVYELADSAEKLARSERESAWREMARQVAHEIKNPLTPMRLSIQQLQRVWSEKGTDREALTQRMAQVLIEQIDTLSHIATAFSDFAKMPTARPAPLDVKEVMANSISLFSQSYPHEFVFASPAGSYVISADREQVQRIFSNLLKNAVQAIPDDRKGRIELRLAKADSGFIRMDVEDNGRGIREADRSRIFVPNFTTKSGGTGLGLAMVKNIVEQGGGTVSFHSTEDVGTVFTLLWPEAGDAVRE